MKNKIALKSLLLAGLTAAAITGCGKPGVQAAGTEAAAAAQKQETPASGQDIIQVEAAASSDGIIETRTSAAGGAESNNSMEAGASLMGGNEVDDTDLIRQSVDALKKYLDISVDLSKYDVGITFFEAVDEKDTASYFVFFEALGNKELLQPEENIGPDGYPLPEIMKKLKPEYSISFSETKEITDLQSMYMNQEARKTPLTIEEVKSLAKDFLIQNQMTKDSNPVFMGSGYGSNVAMALYENGKDGAVQVVINPLSGKIEGFSYMTKERAQLLMRPVEEGFGVG